MSRITEKINVALLTIAPSASESERLLRGDGFWYRNEAGNWVWVDDQA